MKAVIRNQDTMRKRAEALSASEIRYRRLFETAKDGILILDAETGMIVDVNPFLVEMLGFSHEQFLGKRIWEIGFFKDIVKNKVNFLELQQKEYIRYEDLPLETADGRRIDVEFVSNVYWVGHQKVIQCNIRDITERKRAEKELNQLKHKTDKLARSNKELEQFAYVASHDLQEPLRMVTSYVQLLARRYKDKLDADADEFIAFAVDGATRMQRVIDDLLIYARVDTRGKEFEPTDCEAVLQQSLNNLKVSIDEKGARVTHDPLPTVMADYLQLTQLFQNLIGNAIKFHGDEPPHIHVSCKSIEEWEVQNGELKSEIRNLKSKRDGSSRLAIMALVLPLSLPNVSSSSFSACMTGRSTPAPVSVWQSVRGLWNAMADASGSNRSLERVQRFLLPFRRKEINNRDKWGDG